MRPLRPSQFGQAMYCGLSVHAPYDRPPEDGDAAREGTCAAWLAEVVLNGLVASPAAMIGQCHENGWEVDAQMAKHIAAYIEAIPAGGQAECYEETPDIKGTADHRVMLADNHLQITDLKYGYRIVDEFMNWQLLAYLWLYCKVHDHMPPTVTLAVYQPRAIHKDGPYRKWELTYWEYQPLLQQIDDRIEALKQGENMGVVGDHCLHCLNAVGCQALTQSVYAVADIAQQSRVYHTPTPQQLGDELDMLTRMEALVKARKTAIEEEAIYRVGNGGYLPGWVMRSRFGKKKFTVDEATIPMLTGIDPTETKTCTPAELIRRGADEKVVASITTTPRIGYKLERFEGAEKVAAQFRAPSAIK